jgi:hypothetical protein
VTSDIDHVAKIIVQVNENLPKGQEIPPSERARLRRARHVIPALCVCISQNVVGVVGA